MIWEYVLGGRSIVSNDWNGFNLVSSLGKPQNWTAPLKTCRQVFLETHSYPITLRLGLGDDPGKFLYAIHDVKARQRKQIRLVSMRTNFFTYSRAKRITLPLCYWSKVLRRALPDAKEFELLIWRDIFDDEEEDADIQDKLASIHALLKSIWEPYGCTIKVKSTSERMESWGRTWTQILTWKRA